MKDELSNLLNDDQKAAILTALKWIGLWVSMDISDSDDLQPNGVQKLKANSIFLKFDLSSSLLNKFENDEELLFTILKTIPPIIKPWFIIETYMMVSSEGNITSRAMQITLTYCEKIGISENIYLNTVKQAYIETGDYRPGMFDI